VKSCAGRDGEGANCGRDEFRNLTLREPYFIPTHVFFDLVFLLFYIILGFFSPFPSPTHVNGHLCPYPPSSDVWNLHLGLLQPSSTDSSCDLPSRGGGEGPGRRGKLRRAGGARRSPPSAPCRDRQEGRSRPREGCHQPHGGAPPAPWCGRTSTGRGAVGARRAVVGEE
jgi:hypothetical protein